MAAVGANGAGKSTFLLLQVGMLQRSLVCRCCVEDLFGQDEMLREADVSPPLLSALLGELRQRGVDTKIPVTVSQAAENPMALVQDGNGPQK